MQRSYTLLGMTCVSCEAKIKSALLALPSVETVSVSLQNKSVVIAMNKSIPLLDLQNAIGQNGKYTISAVKTPAVTPAFSDSTTTPLFKTHSFIMDTQTAGWGTISPDATENSTTRWFSTYKPLLIIFAFITGISLLTSWSGNTIQWMIFMQHFMAGFFIVFSFFKLLNIHSFAQTYAMYDIIAKKLPGYGFVYPFIELLLGIAFLINFNPLITNATTLVIMTLGLIGVLQSVLNKEKIQCACLGNIFNLPMSNITIIEDALMIAMSAGMLYILS